MTEARHHVIFVPCSLCSRVPFPCWNLCDRVVFPCSLCSLVIPDFSFLVVCVPVLHFPVPCFSVPFPGGIRQCSFIYSVVFISYHRLPCLSLQESRSIPKIWFLLLRDILRTGFSSPRRNLSHWNRMTLSIYLHHQHNRVRPTKTVVTSIKEFTPGCSHHDPLPMGRRANLIDITATIRKHLHFIYVAPLRRSSFHLLVYSPFVDLLETIDILTDQIVYLGILTYE